MIIGYNVYGHDNNSYMLGDETRKANSPEEREFYDWRFIQNGKQHPASCPKCGRKVDCDYINPKFNLRKKKMDFSSTYDGYTIVSERFKNFCIQNKITNIEFISLPKLKEHFWFRVTSIIEIDPDNSEGIRFLNYCHICEHYAGVFGTSRLRFKNYSTSIPKGFSKTDIGFAQAHEQSYLIIADSELAMKIKAEKFKGLDFEKIEN